MSMLRKSTEHITVGIMESRVTIYIAKYKFCIPYLVSVRLEAISITNLLIGQRASPEIKIGIYNKWFKSALVQ